MAKNRWKDEEIVRRFQAVGRALLLHDIEDSHSGNIAMRRTDSQGRDQVIITSTGSQKGDLLPGDICFLSADGTDFGYYKASSETDIHAKVLDIEGAGASVHAHTKEFTYVTFDDLDKPSKPPAFLPIDPLGHYHLKEVPVDWVAVPSGSDEMVTAITKRLEDHPVTLIQGHGAFARARTIEEALWLLCITNHAGRVVRLAQRLKVDVDGIRKRIKANPDSYFQFEPVDYVSGNDDICDFPEEEELLYEFRRAGARIFESKVSPFHTGSLSVRGIRDILYAPKASMPRQIKGPLFKIPLKPDSSDSAELRMHKAIYEASNFQSVIHCYVPEAEAHAHFIYPGESEPIERIIPIDAEGSFLYLVIPVIPPDVDIKTLVRLLHDYKVVVVRGGGVWGVGHQSLSEVLHHPASVREVCLYRIAAFERGLDLKKMEPKKAQKW